MYHMDFKKVNGISPSQSRELVFSISPIGRMKLFNSIDFMQNSSMCGTTKGKLNAQETFRIDQLQSVQLQLIEDSHSEHTDEFRSIDDSTLIGLHHSTYQLVRLSWKNGKTTYLLAKNASELVEVIGAHLKHYNYKKKQTVNNYYDIIY